MKRSNVSRTSPFVRIALAGWILAGATAAHAAFEPAAVFAAKCSSCHSVGRGIVVGPDLAGVTARHDRRWLHRFIRSSQSLVAAGDPAAVELFGRFRKVMPDHPFSDAEIDRLLDFIAAGGPRRREEVRHASTASASEVALGRALFLGERRLARGGAACVRCHVAGPARVLGGGTLAGDLTRVYTHYRDWGLTRALAEPQGRLMAALYRRRPLTRQEAFALKAFLYRADRATPPGDRG
jgi:ubiquinol-cytochrome c reductase cytochrome c subunit